MAQGASVLSAAVSKELQFSWEFGNVHMYITNIHDGDDGIDWERSPSGFGSISFGL